MKKSRQKTKEEKPIDILKKLAKKIETQTTDVHDIKRNIQVTNRKLYSLETKLQNVEVRLQNIESINAIIKADLDKMGIVLKGVDRDAEDIIGTTEEILRKMVTQKELSNLSKRVATIEQQ